MKYLKSLIVVFLLINLSAQAQEFPSKPIRITSPFPVGSGPDVVVRMLSEKLQSYWSQSVVVDTKAGANGVLAIDQTKRSNPDGHDLLILDNGHATIIPNLYKKLTYDVDRDLAPITLVMSVPFFVTTSSDGPIKSVADLIALSIS
jgi:tripartite-type tricarboxylate transporter receptor subunit TctC